MQAYTIEWFRKHNIPGDHYAVIDDGEIEAICPTENDAWACQDQTGGWGKVVRVDQLVDWQLAQ